MTAHTSVRSLPEPEIKPLSVRSALVYKLLRNPSVVMGLIIVLVMLVVGLAAPLLASVDPIAIDPTARNRFPMAESSHRLDDGTRSTVAHLMGTDSLGRDVYSRVLYGARVSLLVGITVAVVSITLGLAIGLIAGYFPWLDRIVMRIMDGLMAIPAILLAIALVSLSSAGILTVIVAIIVPEIPRVVRLVRSVVLSARHEPYVEAAVTVGTRTLPLLIRHILPNTVAPLIVQGTFICASAILVEAILSFLGIGIPPEIPTWGNIMAEGRQLFRLFPHNILFPGIFLGLTVLAINILGDGLRDVLDPKMEKRA
ncbi:ABC transporter permease [Rhizobium sullae]|uniref:Peptide/nickel transport system permease protein n=1 Tax=Rhizobium sullae TaxID=50338 RepID=A0A4R3PSR5_RHISU|nr:peptide/nickel transport system permease protein [Rhizobium sullae]